MQASTPNARPRAIVTGRMRRLERSDRRRAGRRAASASAWPHPHRRPLWRGGRKRRRPNGNDAGEGASGGRGHGGLPGGGVSAGGRQFVESIDAGGRVRNGGWGDERYALPLLFHTLLSRQLWMHDVPGRRSHDWIKPFENNAGTNDLSNYLWMAAICRKSDNDAWFSSSLYCRLRRSPMSWEKIKKWLERPTHKVAARQPAVRDAGADGPASRMSSNQLREQA